MAVWVEDKDGGRADAVALGLAGGAGPFQWLPDLKRWYQADQDRKQIEKKEIFFTVSRPTRPPGKYKVIWDGKDNNGKQLAGGEYTITIEAAREHGTYQSIRKQVTLEGKPFTEELKGNVEIKSASIEYRRKPAAKVVTRLPVLEAAARPLRRRLNIRFAKLMRWLHIYLSMFSLAVVLFFSVTGITLNHPGLVLRAEPRAVARPREKSAASGCTRAGPGGREAADRCRPSHEVSKLEIVEHLRNTHSDPRGTWPTFGWTRANASSRSRARATRPTPSSTAKPAITG